MYNPVHITEVLEEWPCDVNTLDQNEARMTWFSSLTQTCKNETEAVYVIFRIMNRHFLRVNKKGDERLNHGINRLTVRYLYEDRMCYSTIEELLDLGQNWIVNYEESKLNVIKCWLSHKRLQLNGYISDYTVREPGIMYLNKKSDKKSPSIHNFEEQYCVERYQREGDVYYDRFLNEIQDMKKVCKEILERLRARKDRKKSRKKKDKKYPKERKKKKNHLNKKVMTPKSKSYIDEKKMLILFGVLLLILTGLVGYLLITKK